MGWPIHDPPYPPSIGGAKEGEATTPFGWGLAILYLFFVTPWKNEWNDVFEKFRKIDCKHEKPIKLFEGTTPKYYSHLFSKKLSKHSLFISHYLLFSTIQIKKLLQNKFFFPPKYEQYLRVEWCLLNNPLIST